MKRSTEYPEFMARFYDTIYQKVRNGIDNEFFLKRISGCRGKILEIGVGTGRLFLSALEQGADIYGIDISRSMIQVLHGKMKSADRHRVWIQDAVYMDMDMQFDLIIAPFRMFSHVVATEDQLKMLNRVAAHLVPRGEFIFDLYVPNLKILQEGFDRYVDFEEEYEKGKMLRRTISAHSDLIEQITHVTMTLNWEEDGKEISESWDFPMRFFFRFEIEHLVRRSDLSILTIYGDYTEGELTGSSTDFVIICEKNN